MTQRILGFVILALPFLAIAGIITYTRGIKATLLVFGITATIVAVVWVGSYLAFG